jgi:hypothetical protein
MLNAKRQKHEDDKGKKKCGEKKKYGRNNFAIEN